MFATSIFAVILDACDAVPSLPANSTPIAPTADLPSQPAEAAARVFLQAWSQGDYTAMYLLLSPRALVAITQQDFIKRYQDALSEATVTVVRPQFVSALEEGNTATIQFQTRFETAALGVIEEDNALALVREGKPWGVMWAPTNILQDLTANNVLKLYPARSARGNIYDRAGQAIAVGQKAILVSVWPAEMRRNQAEAKVLAALEAIVGLSQYEIQRKYANLNPEWKTTIATITPDAARANVDALALPGLVLEERDARFYALGPAAAHLAGYVGQISAEELAQWYGKGYREGEYLGRAGLEKWGEKYLAGGRGGRLVVLTPSGQEVKTIKEQPAQQSQSIYSTIDNDLQNAAYAILNQTGRRGSIVVMDVRNSALLALVSAPAFDPNAFIDSARQRERQNILTSAQKPLFNRAAQGAYPLGSVYKIVTLATALERGGMSQYTPFT